MPASPPRRTAFHYGWVVLVLTFLTTLVAAGTRSAPSVFILPLEGEFGWTRAAISSAIGLNLLMYGVAAPVTGWIIDRYGPKWVMLGSLALLAVGMAGTLVMTQFWQLSLFWGIVVGLGAGGGATVVGATVANRWFVAHRGLTLGIMNSAVSTGQLVFLPLLMAAVVTAGWRTGSVLLMAVSLGVFVVVLLWMRNDPEDVGLLPYGAIPPSGAVDAASTGAASTNATASVGAGSPPAAVVPLPPAAVVPLPPAAVVSPPLAAGASPPESAAPFAAVLRHPIFWFLALAFLICGATSVGLVLTHLIPYSIDLGIPEVSAASAVGLMGGMNFVGVILAGWLTDRYDARKVLAVTFALRGLSLFLLPMVQGAAGLVAVAMIFGLNWFATVPPVVAIIGDTFGKRSVGTVYGAVFLVHQVGASLAAIGGGVVRQGLGSYQLAFLVGGFIALLGIAFSLAIPTRRQLARATAA